MAEPLAALQDLATQTGLPQSDPRLELALRRASNRFYGDTNRVTLLEADIEERHNGTGATAILLRGAPVLSVTEVVQDGTILAQGTGYTVDWNAGIISTATRSTPGKLGSILVKYRAGYQEVPGDVEDAVLEHAATLAMTLAHIQQEGGGNTQLTTGKEATVGITQKWADAVAKYNLQGRS